MMQLKNILRLAKKIKEFNLFELVRKNTYDIEEIYINNSSLKKEIEDAKALINSATKVNKDLKEENEKIKQTCVNLSHDMLLISKAIGQIYMLTEKAVIEEGLDIEEDFTSKKKKEEYH